MLNTIRLVENECCPICYDKPEHKVITKCLIIHSVLNV